MELRVNFLYPVSYMPPRCQNARTGWLRGATEVALAEIHADDALPAFRVFSTEATRLWRLAPMERRLFVSWGGRLWMESGIDAEGLAERFRAEEFVRGTPLDAAAHLGRFQHVGEVESDDAAALRRLNGGPPRVWQDDGGAAVAARIARRAQDLLLVGGRLFVRGYEPVWRVAPRAGGERISVDTAPPDPFDPFGRHYTDVLPNSAALWRADRGEAALAAAGRQDDGLASIEVLDPSSVRFADDPRALVESAIGVARLLAPFLHALPSGDAEALLDLRDALAASRSFPGPALPAALAAIAGLPEARLPPRRAGAAEAQVARRNAIELAMRACLRWEARPRDGLEWVESGLPMTVTRQGPRRVREVLDAEAAACLARGLGVDVAALEAEARAGGGRLLAVEMECSPYRVAPSPEAAVLAAGDEADPELRVIPRAGADPGAALEAGRAHLALAVRPSAAALAAEGPDDEGAEPAGWEIAR